MDKRMGNEMPGEALTEDLKGYVLRITGGNDKQGFPMMQGVLSQTRVRLLFGKVSKNRFSLDFAPPFAPASALFVALTTFASKLVVA